MSKSGFLFVTIAAALAQGCSLAGYYQTQSTGTGVSRRSTTTWNQTLPNAMDEYFAECVGPLVLAPGDAPDLLGACSSNNGGTLSPAALLFFLGAQTPEVTDTLGDMGIPADLSSGSVFVPFPVPTPLCGLNLGYAVELEQLGLTALDTAWTTRGGSPALRMTFDVDASNAAFSVDLSAVPTCLEAIIPSVVVTNAAPLEVTLHDATLTLYFVLGRASGAVTAALDVEVDIGAVSVDTSSLPGTVTLSAATLSGMNLDLASQTATTENMIIDALDAIPGQVAEQLMASVPSGQSVCGLSVSGGSLVIQSASVCSMTMSRSTRFILPR